MNAFFSAIFVTIAPTVFFNGVVAVTSSLRHILHQKYDELVTSHNVHIAHRQNKSNCTDSQLTLKSHEKTICFNVYCESLCLTLTAFNLFHGGTTV